jgi:dipeptidase
MLKLFLVFASILKFNEGCSNIVVNRDVSLDGSTIVAYNADDSKLYGSLYHYAAADHEEGALRKVYDWDSGEYLGEIPEASHTYNVVGNINEYGVIISETTFGGIGALQSQTSAKVDYGSLIWITLQRSTSAREAIKVIDQIMQTYGYASGGESFYVADQNEAW